MSRKSSLPHAREILIRLVNAWLAFWTFLGAGAVPGRAAISEIEIVDLPELRVNGSPVGAHTQGLELVGDSVYVTARRDTPPPKRALLLRTSLGGKSWDVWDLTPSGPPMLDHPGGFQSDGQRLWIPFAESRNGGKSLIRAYAISGFRPGDTAAPGIEFAVNDHVGALAVLPDQSKLVGAAWDSDTVYVWDLNGNLLQRLSGSDLRQRGFGTQKIPDELPGLAVQDWKFVDGNLVASGLVKSGGAAGDGLSRVIWVNGNLEHLPTLPPLPSVPGNVELGREGMAISGDSIYFLPGDLGATNRLYKLSWTALRNAACDCY